MSTEVLISPDAAGAARAIRHKIQGRPGGARRSVAALLAYFGSSELEPVREQMSAALAAHGIAADPDLGSVSHDDYVILRAEERRQRARAESKENGLARTLSVFQDTLPDLIEELQPAVVHIASGQGTGSGFGVDRDGFVMTNAHVVDEGAEHRIKWSHTSSLTAELVGSDPSTDVAVLHVAIDDLETLMFRPLKTVRLGEAVLALGSPLGLEWSVTVGIVSGLDRTLTAPDGQHIDYMIQTDAQINPGNSGGPLVGGDGEVVGVNAQAYIGSGLGFAIPSDTAQAVYYELREHGTVKRASIGARAAANPFFGDQADFVGQDGGAALTSVRSGGPADSAGLRAGDVLLSLDGGLVDEPGDLFRLLNRDRIGKECPTRYLRDGEAQLTTLEPTARG